MKKAGELVGNILACLFWGLMFAGGLLNVYDALVKSNFLGLIWHGAFGIFFAVVLIIIIFVFFKNIFDLFKLLFFNKKDINMEYPSTGQDINSNKTLEKYDAEKSHTVSSKEFDTVTNTPPQNTEVERQVIQRIGQDAFRKALMDYWGGRCPLTGVTDTRLLRASHIKPWSKCESDAERLDVYNGILLSVHWDAAFDAGLVSFNDYGEPLVANDLTIEARNTLKLERSTILKGLAFEHKKYLAWHRNYHKF